MIMNTKLVLAPMMIAMTIARGALRDGRGISSIKCVTASKPVRPNVLCRRPRRNARPSGH